MNADRSPQLKAGVMLLLKEVVERMPIAASIISFIFTCSVGCGLGAAPPPSNTPVLQVAVLSAIADQPLDPFSRVLQYRRAKRTASAIMLVPQSSKIRPRLMNLAWGRLPVLSIPLAVTNSSAHKIKINPAHEWYGGIWPPTDLYVAVQAEGANGKFWSDAPGYQVGEKDSADSFVILKPGEAKTFDIRLNWPGTGSVPTEPLIDESKPGKYAIKFLLFFKTNGTEQYMESQAVEIEVEK